ncbi:MAG TPA: hypothetical protein VGX23_31155 [Actinocrinis sp.]|nr:hypothetical protein [Actinocrinis sp.]
MTFQSSSVSAWIALVGDRSPAVQSHARIPNLLAGLRERDGLVVDAYWIPSAEVVTAAGPGGDGYSSGVSGFDAVWLLPGSPYLSEAGAVAAARTAREQGIPFLGTCGGFQHAVLEYARNVAGLPGAAHAENDPDAPDPLIVALDCSLVGHETAVNYADGSLAQRILGVERSVERYHCTYALDHRFVETLTSHGLKFTGHDEAGEIRVLELPEHPFFLGTLFQPELAGDGTRPHPIIRALAEAAVAHAERRNAGPGAPAASTATTTTPALEGELLGSSA